MSKAQMDDGLLRLYRQIRETPALTVDFPAETGKGRISRLDTRRYSLSAWNMEFHRDTFVQGRGGDEMRLLFCTGNGVEWTSDRGTMRLDHNEACFCAADGSTERMCYQGNLPFSFLSVAVPAEQFTGMIGCHFREPQKMTQILQGRSFPINAAIRRSLHEIGSLESVHNGFEMMRLEAHLLESLSYCLEAALGEPAASRGLHHDDLKIIDAIRERIDGDPAAVPDIASLAREYCMSTSKLTRAFKQVCGISLHAYVIEARMQKGIELLHEAGVPVCEIAERVGYAKPSQFSADFRKRFGVLPREYRTS